MSDRGVVYSPGMTNTELFERLAGGLVHARLPWSGDGLQAGVLVMLTDETVPSVLLGRRAMHLRLHPGEVAFPGGKRENEDDSPWATALREAREEVGVPPRQVRVVRALSPVYIPPSNFEVSPFVGLSAGRPDFRRQESEVAELIEVPVTQLLSREFLEVRRMTTSYATDIEVPAFLLNGHVVWGATAMMLNELKSLLEEVL